MDMLDDWLHALRSWAKDNGNVRELWLFGSRAQGCARPNSDVDLAIALMPDKGTGSSPFGELFCLKIQMESGELKAIVGRHVSFEGMVPGAAGHDWDSMVRCFGIRLWSREESSSSAMPLLILKRAGGGGWERARPRRWCRRRADHARFRADTRAGEGGGDGGVREELAAVAGGEEVNEPARPGRDLLPRPERPSHRLR